MLPGDVDQGKVDPRSDEAIARSFDLASSIVLGPAPLVSKMVDGSLGVIAGVKPKTHGSLITKANDMELHGYTPQEIWSNTGLFKSFDGKEWLRELPSNKADLKMPLESAPAQGKLSDILDFPEIFKEYPSLNNFTYEIVDFPLAGFAGLFQPDKHNMVLNKGVSDKKDLFRTILHELQHAVQFQDRRNFGASNASVHEDLVKNLYFAHDEAVRAGDSQRVEMVEQLFKDLFPEGNVREDFLTHLYFRNQGEIEARTTERRADWSDLQRTYETPKQSHERIVKMYEEKYGAPDQKGPYAPPFTFPESPMYPAAEGGEISSSLAGPISFAAAFGDEAFDWENMRRSTNIEDTRAENIADREKLLSGNKDDFDGFVAKYGPVAAYNHIVNTINEKGVEAVPVEVRRWMDQVPNDLFRMDMIGQLGRDPEAYRKWREEGYDPNNPLAMDAGIRDIDRLLGEDRPPPIPRNRPKRRK